MKHPLRTSAVWAARWVVVSVLFGLGTWLSTEAGGGGSLLNEAAPYGIVSLELAGTPERARRILASWDRKVLRDRKEPRRSIYFDFAFIPVYSNLLALCCLMVTEVAGRRSPGLSRGGVALAWAQYAAGLSDVIENCALLKMLHADAQGALGQSTTSGPWPQIAALFAGLKFVIIGFGLLYILGGLLYFAAAWITHSRHPVQGSGTGRADTGA